MEESICCGAVRLWDTDLCSKCLEHADFVEVDDTPSEHFNQKVKECLENFKKQDHE